MLIEILGKFFDNHSLSIINRNLAIGLHNAGVAVQIIAIDSYDHEFKVDKESVKILQKLRKSTDKVPDIQVRHTYPPIWQWPENKKTKIVFIQPWEFPKVPFEWQYKFESFADALIVPSSTNAEVFIKGGLRSDKVFVVPNGYDDKIFKSGRSTSSYVEESKFNFVYVGNSQWRKGLDILLNAWHKCFKSYDNARLIIKDNPRVYGDSNIINEIIRMQYKTSCAPITYIDSDLSVEDMADLYSSCSVIVHPYRAEGFGMHIQEAVASGCFPIIPNKGPTNDFIPDDCSIKIDTTATPINIADANIFAMKPGDSSTLMGTHTFIDEPSEQSLEKALMYLYHSHERDKIVSKVKGISTLNTWDKVIKQYIDVFNKISNNQVRRT